MRSGFTGFKLRMHDHKCVLTVMHSTQFMLRMQGPRKCCRPLGDHGLAALFELLKALDQTLGCCHNTGGTIEAVAASASVLSSHATFKCCFLKRSLATSCSYVKKCAHQVAAYH